MEKKNKIINYRKENYKLMIPIALMIVVFIAAIVYYKVTIYDNYSKKEEEQVYQWFYEQKYEYTGIASINRRDEIVDFKSKGIDVNFDSTPIYYQKKERIVFPNNMSVVMPTLNCTEYLANKYSYITSKKGNNTLVTEKYNNRLGHYFLYDGYDLYFFLDEVTIKIDDSQITLSPLSYIIAKPEKSISYYDKKADNFKTIKTDKASIIVENTYYKIDVFTDTIDYYGTDVILTGKVEELNPIKLKKV